MLKPQKYCVLVVGDGSSELKDANLPALISTIALNEGYKHVLNHTAGPFKTERRVRRGTLPEVPPETYCCAPQRRFAGATYHQHYKTRVTNCFIFENRRYMNKTLAMRLELTRGVNQLRLDLIEGESRKSAGCR